MSNHRIDDLLGRAYQCKCGLSHNCKISKVFIEDDAINKLPEVIKEYNYKNVTVVSDNNTYEICGRTAKKLLADNNIKVNSIVLTRDGVLVPDEIAVTELIDKTKKDTDLIVAVGSGVINDLCKFVSFKLSLPYFIVATAPSMDGYASAGAALIEGNMKVTYQTHTPEVIIADINVLKNAPDNMIKAGLGDMVGKFSAINDWKLGSIITGERYCDFVAGLVEASVESCIENADSIIGRKNSGIKKLTEGLIIVGIAMSFMDNSRPASGSEHHLSHFYEVIGIMEKKPYFLHGIDVFYSTFITGGLRHKLAEIDLNECKNDFNYDDWKGSIKRIYKNAADGVIQLQDKLGFYSEETRNRNIEKIIGNWKEIKEVLLQAPNQSEVHDLLKKSGLDVKEFYDEYGSDVIKNSIIYAKDLKDRYTVLWLLSDLGLLEDFAVHYKEE